MALVLPAVAACGDEGGENNAASALRGNEQNMSDGNGMAHDASGPFGAVEMRMRNDMMAATGANASETWVRKMIAHHRGTVEMSQVLINGGGDPAFVQMARTGAEKQQREIGELERLLAGGITGGSGEANPFGPVEQTMHQQMMAATGASLSETWARKMIAHHQGAVDMSEILIRQGGNPQVLAMARRTVEDQRREMAHLEAMLRGEEMPTAGAAAATPTPAAPAKEASRDGGAATRRSNTAPKAAAPRREQPKQAAPRPAPRPEPAPAPKAECLPEHRAAGHC